jgi:hypothetical protein
MVHVMTPDTWATNRSDHDRWDPKKEPCAGCGVDSGGGSFHKGPSDSILEKEHAYQEVG